MSAERSAAAPRPSAPGIERVVVVVPARDEDALIGRCIDSVTTATQQLALVRPDVEVVFVVVADLCTDSTVEIALAAVDGPLVLTSEAGRVGRARALGVDHALGAAASEGSTDLDRVWIANTDADSAVPPNWLTLQVSLAEADGEQPADVVVGTVRPDPADLTPEQDARWLATHERGRPNGHVHGANLGVRASAYRAAGGFDALDEHEDNVLVARLRDLHAVVVASDAAEVLTSGRTVGRTPGGYAGYLAASL